MLQKALLPITLQESKTDILFYVTLISKLGTKRVHMCHVVDSGFANYKQLSNRIQVFEQWINENFFNLEITSEITSGHTASKLLSSAKNSRVNYIYLPASKRHRLGKILLGSTAADIVRLTDLPVFVHKNRPSLKEDENKKLFNELIIAIDFSPNTERVCSPLYEISNLTNKIKYLHIGKRAGDPFSESKRREHVKEKLEEIKEQHNCGRDIITKDKVGTPSKEILDESKNNNTDLIILGKLNIKKPSEILLGSTAQQVLKKSQASILLVP
ncbi:universal stress protein [Natranaerobius trueperi]|uniref:UspA domain-containing protein n=1 Tax=Natranaerobius trueperi TaxID=759412 RepID=A0A226BUS2_9FIRM|nr:universal stress protein [Natranaerobius trueperi]OWZ82788.1 hypothetical protein CDO51_12285 [Natranaerobius trueperi]